MKHLIASLKIFLLLAILTGIVYPLFVTGIGQLVFNSQANGSIIKENGVVRGSSLIGQEFRQSKYFWSRPSATSPAPYNACASSGSNLGPTNPKLKESIESLRTKFQIDSSIKPSSELLTASGSGLDPHISPAGAHCQVERVAQNRGLAKELVEKIVLSHTQTRQLGILGEPVVNVLTLNLELDRIRADK
ncbi:potassium-transporting ATPase subunit KdpC [bacterium]|nr:potassium-transporting ATPase subunit KdpC [bacterium]